MFIIYLCPGDKCDQDMDGDGIADTADNCPYAANPSQVDVNGTVLFGFSRSLYSQNAFSPLAWTCIHVYVFM